MRGINRVIKSMICSHLVDLVCLQETKVRQTPDSLVRSLGMGRCLEWGVVETRGQLGGILVF